MPPGNNLKRVLGCGSHNALGPTLANQRSDLSKGKYPHPHAGVRQH